MIPFKNPLLQAETFHLLEFCNFLTKYFALR